MPRQRSQTSCSADQTSNRAVPSLEPTLTATSQKRTAAHGTGKVRIFPKQRQRNLHVRGCKARNQGPAQWAAVNITSATVPASQINAADRREVTIGDQLLPRATV